MFVFAVFRFLWSLWGAEMVVTSMWMDRVVTSSVVNLCQIHRPGKWWMAQAMATRGPPKPVSRPKRHRFQVFSW